MAEGESRDCETLRVSTRPWRRVIVHDVLPEHLWNRDDEDEDGEPEGMESVLEAKPGVVRNAI